VRKRAHAAARRRSRRGAPQPDRATGARQARGVMSTQRLAEPFGNFAALIAEHARADPGHAAIVHGDRAIDYAALDAAMDRVAVSLQRGGIEPREPVAICAGTSIEYLVVFLGCLRAGVAAALVSPSLSPAAIERMVADAGAKRVYIGRSLARA